MTETIQKQPSGEKMPEPPEDSATTFDPDNLPEGFPIGSDLVIERPLGTGGFATVYLARNKRVEHIRAAVKVLLNEYMTDESAKRRFLLEAQMGASLSSRHVVQVQSFGELSNGTPYLVMEYIVGPDLEQVLAVNGALTTLQTARVARDILIAVEEAHQHGIVHRDLKPANVFLVHEYGTKEPIAKVGDFGIGKQLGRGGSEQDKDHKLTIAGQILCTPAYAAPELLRGNASQLTDIYALGHVFAELMEGEPPYVGIAGTTEELHPMAIASNQIRSRPVPLEPSTEQSVLGPIIRRALEKNPVERYQSVSEMLDHIWTALDVLDGDPETDRSPLSIDFHFDASGEPRRDTDAYRPARPSSKRRSARTTGSSAARTSNATRLPSLDGFIVKEKKRKRALAIGAVAALLVAGLAIFLLARGSNDEGDKEMMSALESELEAARQEAEQARAETIEAVSAAEAEQMIREREVPDDLIEGARAALMDASRAALEVQTLARSTSADIVSFRARQEAQEQARLDQDRRQETTENAGGDNESGQSASAPPEREVEERQPEASPTPEPAPEPADPTPSEPAEEDVNPFGTGLR